MTTDGGADVSFSQQLQTPPAMDGGAAADGFYKLLSATGCNVSEGSKWAVVLCLFRLVSHYLYALVGWILLLLLALFVGLTLDALE